MAAEKTDQASTSQAGSKKEQRGQQTGLARQSRASVLPVLWADPLDIVSASPFSLINRMQEEVNRIFSEAFGASPARVNEPSGALWAPAVDVALQDGNLVVSAELPGLSEKDVKIEIDNDVLTIQGERKIEQEQDEKGIRRTERRYGRFYRAIALPEGADAEKAQAEFKDGVLRVTIPVSQRNVRQIPIQASSQPSRAQPSQQAATKAQAPEKAA